MEFTNIHGEKITIDPAAKKVSPKKAGGPAMTDGTSHKGWFAVGYSPEQIEQGKLDHAAAVELAVKEGRDLPAFNVVTFVRISKARKIRTQPYATAQAAQDCCDLAEKQAGWIYCSVRDSAKVGKKK